MKHFNKNLFRVLPLFALGLGTTLALDSTAQAQPGGRGRGGGGNRQFGQNFGERGEQGLVPAPRLAVPTVEELTDALELTPEQQKKMTTVLGEMQKRINNTLTPEQRTKLETLRTQPVVPQSAKVGEKESGGFARPERGQGGGRQGWRQGMGGQGMGGRGMGGRGQAFGGQERGGPERGGMERGRPEFRGPEVQGEGQDFGGRAFGGAPQDKAQGFGGPEMGGPGRGGRRGMGQGGIRSRPEGAPQGNEGPIGFGQPPLPQPTAFGD